MHGVRRNRVLTSIALALALTLVGGISSVLASEHASAIESIITAPDPSKAAPLAEAETPPGSAPDPVATVPTTNEGALPTVRDITDPVLASPVATDMLIVEKLRDFVTSKQLERIVNRKREREAVEAFYAARNFRPLWIDNGIANKRAVAAMAHLRTANVDGLDPSDYPTPEFVSGAEPTALAEAELRLAAAVLTYARHAQSGRVHFSRIHSDISYNLAIPEPADVLVNVGEAEKVGEALASYNPPHAGYKALKEKLAKLRGQKGQTSPRHIANGPLLKVGMHDDRVPLLRERLGISGGSNERAYDKTVAEAVRKFQRVHELADTGTLNAATINALNGRSPDRSIDIIIANMERWRWMPRDLGKAYSILNVPDFSLKVVRDGATVWRTKVVVGKRTTATPVLSDTMKFITVNPTWNVPPTLLRNEYLPALQQDPTALDRIGIKVVRNPDGSIRMYQPPGDRNALGRLRFNFPNKYLVYQHDTPDKYLFDKPVRAYSNGCMRVQDPLKYAEVLLSIALPDAGYTQERLRRMYGGAEQNISFPTPIPVHLTYQTAFVDEPGKLVVRNDIYHYDERIQAVLRGGDRRIADIAVPSVHRHTDDPGPGGPRLVGSRRAPQEPTRMQTFFERLFR